MTNNLHQEQGTVPHGIRAHIGQDTHPGVSIPSKRVGFLNHSPEKFQFIGPDRAPITVSSIDKCLQIASVISDTGVPNYVKARVPLVSGLNIAEWEVELQDYPDQMLIQYLKFGFPLSLLNPSQLHNTSVKNHHSTKSISHCHQRLFA